MLKTLLSAALKLNLLFGTVYPKLCWRMANGDGRTSRLRLDPMSPLRLVRCATAVKLMCQVKMVPGENIEMRNQYLHEKYNGLTKFRSTHLVISLGLIFLSNTPTWVA